MVTRVEHARRWQRQRALQRERASRAGGADLIIPFVHEKLAPETRAIGERLGAHYVEMTRVTDYWDMVADRWGRQKDFIILEEDVLPTAGMIRGM